MSADARHDDFPAKLFSSRDSCCPETSYVSSSCHSSGLQSLLSSLALSRLRLFACSVATFGVEWGKNLRLKYGRASWALRIKRQDGDPSRCLILRRCPP